MFVSFYTFLFNTAVLYNIYKIFVWYLRASIEWVGVWM